MSKKIINIEEIGYKTGTAEAATTCSCIGTLKYTVEATKKTRKCGSAEEIVKVINNGTGTVEIEAHSDNDNNEEMMGMADATNKMAVNKQGSTRPWVCITAKGKDEDENTVLLAFPRAMITADESEFEFDNGEDEIPYLSQEFSYVPDTINKVGMYIKNEEDLPTGITADQWMTEFDATTMAIA